MSQGSSEGLFGWPSLAIRSQFLRRSASVPQWSKLQWFLQWFSSYSALLPPFISLFRSLRSFTDDQQLVDLSIDFWSERRDLNSGPPVPQTGALTGLRYAPNCRDYSDWG